VENVRVICLGCKSTYFKPDLDEVKCPFCGSKFFRVKSANKSNQPKKPNPPKQQKSKKSPGRRRKEKTYTLCDTINREYVLSGSREDIRKKQGYNLCKCTVLKKHHEVMHQDPERLRTSFIKELLDMEPNDCNVVDE